MASSDDIEITVSPTHEDNKMVDTEETTDGQQTPETAVIPFVPSKLFLAAKWTLDLLDYYGEKLAFFFGITSPKYAVQIRAHDRDVRQEEERKKTESQEFAGWREGQRHGYENPVMNHVQDQVN